MQNNNKYHVDQNTSFTLWRFPKQNKKSSFQAWDSADQILANHVNSSVFSFEFLNSMLIVNDNFGSLTCHLNQFSPKMYTDSKISEIATIENLKLNNLNLDTEITNNTNSLKKSRLVILKLPKNLEYLQFILQQIHQSQFNDVELVASAKAEDINKSVIKIFNRYFTEVNVSLTNKKSRIISAKGKQLSPYSSFSSWVNWTVKNLIISNASNVFSRGSLDQGAAFMLDHLPNCNDKSVIDLACGNGILGLSLLNNQIPKSILFTDESYMAIESVTLNLDQNNLYSGTVEIKTNCQDCLTEQKTDSTDIIICNPPFHQKKAVTDHIAIQMFEDSYRVLKKGGELRIVGNQHLGYFQRLKGIFDSVKLIKNNQKFVIISAIKL
jgi:16S rRNA G1207 methylase RsmC